MADVVVAGGGVVGLLTALLLGRRGHAVVLVEPDDDPPERLAEDDLGWHRPGVPQGQHGHVFRARLCRVLHEEAPDVVDELLAAGIGRSGIDFGEGFEDDLALMSRRPVFEAAFRRLLRSERQVELRTGQRVRGLCAETAGGRVPQVTGVRFDDGEVLEADLVIDCCGRRSAAPRWLAQIGTALASEHHQPCGLHYFARHYRLDQGRELPSTTFPAGAFTPYGIFLAIGQDNGTFCLAGGLSQHDPLRSRFRDPERFEAVMAAMPGMREWAAVGTPVGPVHLLGGLANRRRTLVGDGRPTVTGYVLVGDSYLYTNATFGQGIALGFWQAQALAHRAELARSNPAELLRSFEAWTEVTLGPRYAAQVQVDTDLVDRLREGVEGAPMRHPADPVGALAALRARGDELATPAFYRLDNLLTALPDELADPRLRARVEQVLSSVPNEPAGPGPLPRREFEALLS